jgi:hypothetical protein
MIALTPGLSSFIVQTLSTAHLVWQSSTFWNPKALPYCSMGFEVMLPSACSFIVEVSCHCLTLHVSAYLAIFRCVGCYYSHVLEGICLAGFFCILHVVTLLYVSICVLLFYFLVLFCCFLRACLSACLFVLFVCLVQTNEADCFKNMRVITSYTPEDGHIGRNM